MRCWKCRRKGYLFKCRRCGKYFCDRHRLPEDHYCKQFTKRNIFNRLNEREHHEEHGKRIHLGGIFYNFLKFIPIIGIILLFIIYPYIGKTKISAPNLIFGSFDFSNIAGIIFTIAALITLITAYKYWLLRIRFVRHNRFLVNVLLWSVGLWIFSRHVMISSLIGNYYDWLLLIITSWAIISASLLVARKINSINLASDLACWGLRLLGGVFVFVGFWVLMAGSFAFIATSISNVTWHSQGVFWVLGICLLLLGAFCEFRSVRRFPMMGIWRAD